MDKTLDKTGFSEHSEFGFIKMSLSAPPLAAAIACLGRMPSQLSQLLVTFARKNRASKQGPRVPFA